MPNFPARRDNVYHIRGRRYPSVTAITSVLAKPALITWAAKTAAAAVLSDPYRYDTADKALVAVTQARDDAADRGRLLHELIECWAKGEDLPEVGPEHSGYVNGFLAFARSWPISPLHSETIVVNETHGYAGRVDLIASVSDETWILDFKTSKSVWPEYGLQLVAYQNAEYLCGEPDFEFVPMPAVSHVGVVLIRPDGSFHLKRIREDFDVFLALRRVYDWCMRSED